jgi:hypothetical protein
MPSALRLLFNAATLVPGVTRLPPIRRRLAKNAKGTGGSGSARYCYSVWLRHLVTAAGCGLNTNPRKVAELGPGDSLGVGLAALLTGAERYYAFDVVEHASAEGNLRVLDGLVELLRERAPIPDHREFPRVVPTLPSYEFPHRILGDERLRAALDPARVERIRASLKDCTAPDSLITYRAPWYGSEVIEPGSIDMLFSQAVLEHVDALPETYAAMRAWLAPTGFLSHCVDFKSHGFASEWNGHWTYSDLGWKLVRGKAIWAINREPWSKHVRLLEETGFRSVHENAIRRASSIPAHRFARRFRDGPASDLTTSDVFYQAVRTI